MPSNATIETRQGIGSPAFYGDIDFREIRLKTMAKAGLVAAEVYLLTEGYEQLLNQDNTLIECNKTAPHIDRISIQDERDWDWWVHYRDELPEGDFEELRKQIAWVGKTILTLYPAEDVVELYEERRQREIKEIFE